MGLCVHVWGMCLLMGRCRREDRAGPGTAWAVGGGAAVQQAAAAACELAAAQILEIINALRLLHSPYPAGQRCGCWKRPVGGSGIHRQILPFVGQRGAVQLARRRHALVALLDLVLGVELPLPLCNRLLLGDVVEVGIRRRATRLEDVARVILEEPANITSKGKKAHLARTKIQNKRKSNSKTKR